MKTILPQEITTVEQAQAFFSELHRNRELFHPEDDARDAIYEHADGYFYNLFTDEEADKVNLLVMQAFGLKGFDPCEYVFSLIEH